MHLLSIASTVPIHRFSQIDCLALAQNSSVFAELRPASLRLLERILGGNSGIEERGFSFPDMEKVLRMDATELNKAFEIEAPKLSLRSLETALDQAGLSATDLDALFVCTCTGYLCPGISSHLAEQAGLRNDAYLVDLVGLGCGAAVPTLRAAEGFLSANPGAKVACVAVEICSAAFYADDSPDQLVSLCLFGDAAATTIWSDTTTKGSEWQLGNFDTVHLPSEREKIRFVQVGGHLRNQLDRTVPKLAGEAVHGLWKQSEQLADAFALHGGGRDVIESLRQVLPASANLNPTQEILRKNGNCSSPSVLMSLEAILADPSDEPESIWISSFGAGFSAHSCELTRSRSRTTNTSDS